MRINDGGPAFPFCVERITKDWSTEVATTTKFDNEPGMSLRDWFAGMAMQGWLSTYPADASHPAVNQLHRIVAENAYALADAMLAAREAKMNEHTGDE